jgi:hypothetical protein
MQMDGLRVGRNEALCLQALIGRLSVAADEMLLAARPS